MISKSKDYFESLWNHMSGLRKIGGIVALVFFLLNLTIWALVNASITPLNVLGMAIGSIAVGLGSIVLTAEQRLLREREDATLATYDLEITAPQEAIIEDVLHALSNHDSSLAESHINRLVAVLWQQNIKHSKLKRFHLRHKDRYA